MSSPARPASRPTKLSADRLLLGGAGADASKIGLPLAFVGLAVGVAFSPVLEPGGAVVFAPLLGAGLFLAHAIYLSRGVALYVWREGDQLVLKTLWQALVGGEHRFPRSDLPRWKPPRFFDGHRLVVRRRPIHFTPLDALAEAQLEELYAPSAPEPAAPR
ncbi:MAG: hypothetical protein CMN31_22985 [Sandaracinus sp.]|nr:hypothetical protein [Sandaracinus sp.]MBJ74157.1 hypothetical protein [Sandaracinus sp.]HJL02647.1 hypothetical protein [Polyangiaceae bacterium LLY-WYZ-15_(1-7)]HJL32597.1 hypothetical protein [Polyangiaceae bacterium LLY-WYZ-15_(1-7)]HJL35861.1 hypothetical protein [Polyangiaceae bacterium LLY-WYZ-15_(1-7)]